MPNKKNNLGHGYTITAAIGLFFVLTSILLYHHEKSLVAVPPKSTNLTPVTNSSIHSNLQLPISKLTGFPAYILEYHYIRSGIDQKTDPIGYNLSVSATKLDKDIAALKAAGYTSETMADYAAGKGNAKTVIMTFDDGYEDFYTSAYPILKKYGWTATIYIISGKIGGRYMTWNQLRELKADGIEIAAHTITHINLASATEAEQRHQIFGSKATIESQVGGVVTAFCYPSGKYTALTEQLVKQAGFTSATTEHSGRIVHADDPFQYNRVRIRPSTAVLPLLASLAKRDRETPIL